MNIAYLLLKPRLLSVHLDGLNERRQEKMASEVQQGWDVCC